ncbi:MAG TPA: sugar phosphate isomerase/epimerase [Terriglobia bacterium]|nr:sugar phosphate isomerase/epimerase [Terriglobia bacterium]
MSFISRREAGKMALAGGAAALLASSKKLWGAQWIDSVVRGVQIGAQSYSFRDRPLPAVIQAYQEVGLGEAEIWQGGVEPQVSREQLRQWRLTVPLSHFTNIRRQFNNAGVKIYAYNISFEKSFTDGEMNRGFQMAQALGVKYITASSTVSMAHRIDTYAQKYKIVVGFHNHDDTADPDQFSTPDTFARALKGASPYLAINLDIGHFTAANCDPVSFLKEHHNRIVTLHIKDRKRNHGPAVPFGKGNTPIVEVLHLLRDNHWKIPANIEYEYGPKPGLDTIVEMKKCYAYCRKALLA